MANALCVYGFEVLLSVNKKALGSFFRLALSSLVSSEPKDLVYNTGCFSILGLELFQDQHSC